MQKPVEMEQAFKIKLHDGAVGSTLDVWAMLNAAHEGDLAGLEGLVRECPQLVSCKFDYTSPLHFAVRAGHFEIVRFLVEAGALDPDYKVHPFKDDLVTFAEDRGFAEIADYLRRSLADDPLVRKREHARQVDFRWDERQTRFESAVDKGQHDQVKAMLDESPELALNPTFAWGEGILALPTNTGDLEMIKLLMGYGATVPKLSKWGIKYYFKHVEIGQYLLENGMDPDHRNWREFTLLHDTAYYNEPAKAQILMDHGADINAIDDEYSSTPLAYAAHWGNRDMVTLLLENGADPNLACAPWATPLAWANRKGFTDIADDLKQAGGCNIEGR